MTATQTAPIRTLCSVSCAMALIFHVGGRADICRATCHEWKLCGMQERPAQMKVGATHLCSPLSVIFFGLITTHCVTCGLQVHIVATVCSAGARLPVRGPRLHLHRDLPRVGQVLAHPSAPAAVEASLSGASRSSSLRGWHGGSQIHFPQSATKCQPEFLYICAFCCCLLWCVCVWAWIDRARVSVPICG